jgi:hypothetical protein
MEVPCDRLFRHWPASRGREHEALLVPQLADVFKIARKQRRQMLRRAQADGRDMMYALVELVPDPEVRRIIGHAYGAIREPSPMPPERAVMTTTPVEFVAPTPAQVAPPKPPTGPGTPEHASKRRRRGRARRPAVLRLTPPETAEQRIRAVLADEPSIGIRQLAKRANVSESTTSKYAHVVRLKVSRSAH